MRELKVGDRVWIRDDLENGRRYGDVFWFEKMKKGEKITVSEVYADGSFLTLECYAYYSLEMVDWDKTDENDATRKDIDPNIIKYKEIFDQLLEVGFTREEALKIMLNAGNVSKNA